MTHARLETALAGATVAIDASELDGLLAGYVCGNGKVDRQHVLKALQLDNEDPALDDLLAQMYDDCAQRLGQLEMGLDPLLPTDAKPLRERVDAMVDWTRGFLGGFGLAGATAEILTDDGREVLRDMGTIAASQLALDDQDEGSNDEDESALMELLEFVRVGAMLLHTEVAMAGSPASGRPH